MSSADKTKNKLLDSMRMSKTGATDTAPTEPASKAETAAKPKKAATKKKGAAKKKPAAKKSPAKSVAPVRDVYQAARRIWPD